jgi:hypothetical protein
MGDCCRSGICRRLRGMLTAHLRPGTGNGLWSSRYNPVLLLRSGSHPPGMPRVGWFHAPIRPIRFAPRSLSAASRSHRHSFGWHRSPPLMIAVTSRAQSTAQRLRLATPAGWPTSNRNGRDQIGISGRLPSEYEDAFLVQREGNTGGPGMDTEKTKGDPTPPAITSFSPARSRTSSVQK